MYFGGFVCDCLDLGGAAILDQEQHGLVGVIDAIDVNTMCWFQHVEFGWTGPDKW